VECDSKSAEAVDELSPLPRQVSPVLRVSRERGHSGSDPLRLGQENGALARQSLRLAALVLDQGNADAGSSSGQRLEQRLPTSSDDEVGLEQGIEETRRRLDRLDSVRASRPGGHDQPNSRIRQGGSSCSCKSDSTLRSATPAGGDEHGLDLVVRHPSWKTPEERAQRDVAESAQVAVSLAEAGRAHHERCRRDRRSVVVHGDNRDSGRKHRVIELVAVEHECCGALERAFKVAPVRWCPERAVPLELMPRAKRQALDVQTACPKGSRDAARPAEVAEPGVGGGVRRDDDPPAQTMSQVRTASSSTSTLSSRPRTRSRCFGGIPNPGRFVVSMSRSSTVPADRR
jgi:hypothetical protein